jgi:hypothetical protein
MAPANVAGRASAAGRAIRRQQLLSMTGRLPPDQPGAGPAGGANEDNQAAAALRAATICSAVRPVSSAM